MSMPSRISVVRLIPFIIWILAFSAIPVWNALYPGMDCDAKVYVNAIHSMQAGHDPYDDGIAAQTAFHAQLAFHPLATAPLSYLYSPLTLPLLRMIGSLPPALYAGGYWLIYAAGILAQVLVSLQAAEPTERLFFAAIAPAAPFFPGLIQQPTLNDGNVAFILYGLVFFTALLGWRRGHWRWFYLATLLASCFKIPMLTLLAIPVLSARRQWLPACVIASVGVALFVIQAWIWPTYFHNYLHALELDLSYNHQFGVGPTGLFSLSLLNAGLPYSSVGAIFYVLFALPFFAFLIHLSRQFLDGKFSLQQWIPVMLTGVVLLNPRVMDNDYAPLALSMALILWRAIASVTSTAKAITFCFLFVAVMNAIVIFIAPVDVDYNYFRFIEGFILAGIFAAGCLNLLRQTRDYNLSRCVEQGILESPPGPSGTV
jgi:hypothetical protein